MYPIALGTGKRHFNPVSDEIVAAAQQPDPAVAIHLAGETFSHAQSWIEGALESGAPVIRQLSRA